MNLKLVFLESFENEFKGKKYLIYKFLDPNSLTVLVGTNLKGAFVQYRVYTCSIEYNHNKLKIISAQ